MPHGGGPFLCFPSYIHWSSHSSAKVLVFICRACSLRCSWGKSAHSRTKAHLYSHSRMVRTCPLYYVQLSHITMNQGFLWEGSATNLWMKKFTILKIKQTFQNINHEHFYSYIPNIYFFLPDKILDVCYYYYHKLDMN